MSPENNFDPEFQERLTLAKGLLARVNFVLEKKIVGQEILRRRLVQALLTNGHVLLEGVPGLAKTLAIRTLAEAVDAQFQRIQFTPDLLPADIIGTEIYRPQEGAFEVRKGPVFTNLLLADEINRAPAKVQSALLETMQERQVTIGETSFRVPDPFLVLATQNPIEQEGTYPLPEAQVDRFIAKVKVDYPSPEEELEIISRAYAPQLHSTSEKAVSLDEIRSVMALVPKVYVDHRVKQYIVNLVWASRDPSRYGINLSSLIELGASPRASLSLLSMAQAEALLNGEHFVVPQNVKDVALDVLRHRIMPSYEAEAQGLSSDDLVNQLLEAVVVP